MKGGRSATARQKRWHSWLGQQPCCGCGAKEVALHHCVGSSAKHNKVWIGQDWVIPLCYECHQGKGGVHGDMSNLDVGDMTRKEFEKAAFSLVYIAAFNEAKAGRFSFEDMPDMDAIAAIGDYHR